MNPSYTERDVWELTKERWKAFTTSASADSRYYEMRESAEWQVVVQFA